MRLDFRLVHRSRIFTIVMLLLGDPGIIRTHVQGYEEIGNLREI